MKYSEFIPRKQGYETFKAERARLNNLLESNRAKFVDEFEKDVKKAGEGDPVMQDVVAYYYKSGADRAVSEDYRKYMHFEFLSAASGNEFAIEKLQFFLGYAYDEVVYDDSFGEMKYYSEIDEYNYIYIIGQTLCEVLVEKLNLDANAIARTRDIYDPYKPEYYRDLRKAVDDAIPIAIARLKDPNRK